VFCYIQDTMEIYITNVPIISGSNASEVFRKVRDSFRYIASKTKRRPYVRSVYFNKEKVFIGPFLNHMFEKNWRDTVRRLKLFDCAIDLVRNTRKLPEVVHDPHHIYDILYKFCGITRGNCVFFVQIKENKISGNKTLISVYPER